jgi:hypothetical protein
VGRSISFEADGSSPLNSSVRPVMAQQESPMGSTDAFDMVGAHHDGAIDAVMVCSGRLDDSKTTVDLDGAFKPALLRYTNAGGRELATWPASLAVRLNSEIGPMRNLLALMVLVLVGSASAGELPASELSIGGVSSGATEASVWRQLGAPSHSVDTGEGTDLHYPGLVVTVGWLEPQAPGRQRRVFALHGTGANACTPHGLCPGLPVSTVVRLYGPAELTRRESGSFLEYQPAGTNCWLQASAQADVVQSVSVACQP